MITEDAAISDEFITAKVHGMRSKLLEAERLTALTDCRSLHELFRRIHPSETFEGHAPFQREIVAEHVQSLWRVRRFLSGHIQALFTELVRQFQLDNLKVALRAYQAGMRLSAAEPLMIPVPKELALPIEWLLETPDPRRFVEAVQDTEWRAILAEHVKTTERMDLFRCETALERVYWIRVVKLSAPLGERARRLVTLDAAVHGVLMVLRAKFDYGLDAEQMGAAAFTNREYLNKKTIEALLAARDLETAVEAVPSRWLPPALRRGILTVTALEDALLLHQYRTAVRCFVESVLDISAVVGFYYIKRAELNNLIRLSEGVRHSLPRDEIESHLLMKAQ